MWLRLRGIGGLLLCKNNILSLLVGHFFLQLLKLSLTDLVVLAVFVDEVYDSIFPSHSLCCPHVRVIYTEFCHIFICQCKVEFI